MALNPDASIPALLLSHVAAHGGEVVLRKKDRGIWKPTTWATLGAAVEQAGDALLAAGFATGDAACVLAETRPEWATIDLAILGAGGISVGVSPAEPPEQLGHVLRESNARVLFVENEEQLDKALMARDACPALRRIVIIDSKGLRAFSDAMCENWSDFLARGGARGAWRSRAESVTASQPALLLFPQGVAGKGHMLTHGDALHLVADAAALLSPRPGDERLAVLPMANAIEHVLGLYLALSARVISNYLESPTTVRENLQEVQPTILGADAQTWQRLYARASDAAMSATRLQKLLYQWAMHTGPGSALARALVGRAVRRELGFSRLRIAYVGAAPVAPEVRRWAEALGITIQQIDGQAVRRHASEATYHALKEAAYST